MRNAAPPAPTEFHSKCECGALHITVRGTPTHIHGCTCTLCQRRSGSVMALSAWFDEADTTINGDYIRYYYAGTQDDRLMAGFCPICGGGRFFRTGTYLPGHIAIAVGNFADPAFPAPDHIHWWPNRPAWLGAPLGPTPLNGN